MPCVSASACAGSSVKGFLVVKQNVSAVFWDHGDVGEGLSRTNPYVVLPGRGV